MFVVNPFEVILGVGNASVCSVFVSEVNLAVGVAVEVKGNERRSGGPAEANQMNSNDNPSNYAELAWPCALFVGRSWPQSAVCALRQLRKTATPGHLRKFSEKEKPRSVILRVAYVKKFR